VVLQSEGLVDALDVSNGRGAVEEGLGKLGGEWVHLFSAPKKLAKKLEGSEA
jgi:hypothetical protein